MSTTTSGAGLEGVVAGESEICLYRRVRRASSATAATTFIPWRKAPLLKKSIWLLWKGTLPKQAELEQLKADLFANYAHSRRR